MDVSEAEAYKIPNLRQAQIRCRALKKKKINKNELFKS